MPQHRRCFLLLVSSALIGDFADALEVERPRCEHLREPFGVDTPRPRLSWALRSERRGDRQTAYRVLVATSPANLAAENGDAWDSGKVASDETQLLRYAGREPESHERFYWSVRVWDAAGEPSAWSEPASWMAGVLDEGLWGDWIGKPVPERETYLRDAQWVWLPGENAKSSAPVAARYFRKAFDTRRGQPIEHAVLRVTGDDHVAIHLNGRSLGTRSGHTSTKELDLSNLITPGRNVLALRGDNRGDRPNPAGVIAWLRIEYADGGEQVVMTDASWLSTLQEEEGWVEPEFDDSSWMQAEALGEAGAEPWGPVRHAEDRRLAARCLRREFTIDKPVDRAIVSWCGLGCSELHANGSRVGDQALSPGMSQYPVRAYYITRDVTTHVNEGANALAVTLGNGRFYAPRSEVYAGMPTYGPPMLRLCLTVEHPDGTSTVIKSDESWRLTDEGPIVANNEYDGEEYDARRELGPWRTAGYDDSAWSAAETLPSPTKRLQAEPIAPMRMTETLRPVGVTEPRPGAYVFDFGQNLVGWCRLRVAGPEGTRLRLRHAERVTDDGELYVANLRGAKATDAYTLRGGGLETWEPRFTLHGFRYVEVTGFPGEPNIDTLTACVVHDDLEPVGEFACSDETVNRVYRNARWGFRGNYRTAPLDCPQRDERQGWLGDRLETARSESYVYDVAAFYAKWLQDIRDVQQPSGSLPDIAPGHWPRYSDNVVWPSASVLLPGILYEQYGDLEPIRAQYECNARWVDYMASFLRDDRLIARDSYGDWCVPPESAELIHSRDPSRITDTVLLASAFYFYDLRLMQRYATLLGKGEDAERYGREAARLRDAVNANYFDPEAHQYSNGTQTSSVLPLAFGLPPTAERDGLAETLADHVAHRDGGAIATGLVGGQFLCRTLTDIGRPDLAFGIASRNEYPSWGYMASQGATTIWELWNGDTADPAMNSGNHVMLVGDLVTWLYEDLAGVAPDPAEPGFRGLVLRPQPVQGLSWAKATYRSPRGNIESHWRRDGAGLTWRVAIPPGVTAEVHLPTANLSGSLCEAEPLDQADGIRVLGVRDGRIVAALDSGSYTLTVADTLLPGEQQTGARQSTKNE